MRTYLTLGGIFGFLAVAIGASGAHALKATLEANQTTTIFQTGVQYHSMHALALLLIALLIGQFPNTKPLRMAGGLFAVGIVIFSGSLYTLALTNIKIYAPERLYAYLTQLIGHLQINSLQNRIH